MLQSGEDESQLVISIRQYGKKYELLLTCVMHSKGILCGTEENSHSVGHDTRFMKSRLNRRRTRIMNGLVKHVGF